MTWSLITKSFVVWLVILGAALGNAALRELVFSPRFGKVSALTVSGILLSLLILLIAWVSLPWLGTRRAPELLAVGAGWLALTVLIDLVLGTAQGKSVQALADAYWFREGNLWPVVVLVTFCAPWLVARLRGWV